MFSKQWLEVDEMTLLEHVRVVVRLPTVGYHLKGGRPSIFSVLIVIENIMVLVIGIEPLLPSMEFAQRGT